MSQFSNIFDASKLNGQVDLKTGSILLSPAECSELIKTERETRSPEKLQKATNIAYSKACLMWSFSNTGATKLTKAQLTKWVQSDACHVTDSQEKEILAILARQKNGKINRNVALEIIGYLNISQKACEADLWSFLKTLENHSLFASFDLPFPAIRTGGRKASTFDGVDADDFSDF